MRAWSFIVGFGAVAATAALVLAGPDPNVPRDDLTPGATATDDLGRICAADGGPGAYVKARPFADESLRALLAERYGIDLRYAGHRNYTIDHRIPRCLGGADTVDNLWLQPNASATDKDKVEVKVCKAVCAGSMSLPAGRAIFQGDWRSGQ